jgi:hypothetical protein
MVTGAVAGNISTEATSPSGNIFPEAMGGKSDEGRNYGVSAAVGRANDRVQHVSYPNRALIETHEQVA